MIPRRIRHHQKCHLLCCLALIFLYFLSVAVASLLVEVDVDIRHSLHDEEDSSVQLATGFQLPASVRKRLLTVSFHPHCVSTTQPAYLLTSVM